VITVGMQGETHFIHCWKGRLGKRRNKVHC
jgi:hypothetical protein